PAPERHQRRDDALAVVRPQDLVGDLPDLRSVEAEPDLPRIRLVRPEPDELLEIPVALRLLPRDRTVHGDLLPDDVLEGPVVGGGRAALVVLGRQSVDRYADLQAWNRCPLLRNRAHGAGDQLRVDAARGQLRKQLVQLAKTDEGLTADERQVNRFFVVDDLQ